MAQTARVLLVGKDAGEDSLGHTLRLCGWDCVEVEPDEELPAGLDGARRPDVVILNLLSDFGRRAPREFVAFARAVRALPGGPRMPVMMVGERRPEHTAGALVAAANADVDDVMLRPLNGVQITSRLKALTRLGTMQDELVRRFETTSRYGIDAPSLAPGIAGAENAEILIVGGGHRYGVFEAALASAATLTGALTRETALDYLARRSFDLVIVDAGSDGAEAEEFCRRCRGDARLFNVPIIVVADPGTVPESSSAFASGVTDLLESPIQPEELKVRMMALVREVRFRDAMRAIYRDFRHHATGDALTGLYTRGFALEHLRGLIGSCRARATTFSLCYAEIRNMTEINSLYGHAVGDRIIRQVGSLIGILMRGEDLTARYRGNAFVAMMPDTALAAARVAMKRVGGVINHTDFTVAELSTPIPVVCAVAAGELEDGDTPEAMVARVAGMAAE